MHLPGEGAFFLGAGGFIKAALSIAAFLSETITDGDTACLPLCPLGLLRLLRGDLDLDLYEVRLEPLELLEELEKNTIYLSFLNTLRKEKFIYLNIFLPA